MQHSIYSPADRYEVFLFHIKQQNFLTENSRVHHLGVHFTAKLYYHIMSKFADNYLANSSCIQRVLIWYCTLLQVDGPQCACAQYNTVQCKTIPGTPIIEIPQILFKFAKSPNLNPCQSFPLYSMTQYTAPVKQVLLPPPFVSLHIHAHTHTTQINSTLK